MFSTLILCVVAAPPAAVSLFNGKDFTGWTATSKDPASDWKQTWSVKDGHIVCTGKPNGYLATTTEYADYTLTLQWRFPAGSKGGNSGVLLHVQSPDKYWPTSVEAQLQSGSAGDFWLIMPPDVTLNVDKARQDPKRERHFFRMKKDEAIEKPFGEWNDYKIVCSAGDINIHVNGQHVNTGTNGNLRKGRIALQSEGTEIHFRTIELTPNP
jgi:hypothetical protein